MEMLTLNRIKCRHECRAALLDMISSAKLNLKSLTLAFLSISDNQLFDIFDELLKKLTNDIHMDLTHLNLMGNTITSLRTFKKLLKLLDHPKNQLSHLTIYIHLEKYDDSDGLMNILESPRCKLKSFRVMLDNFIISKM